jgi:protoheme IX farnesyltransferase
LSLLRDVIALSKPRLSALVLVTGGGGLWLAPQPVPARLAVCTLAGLTMVVGAANALNNYLERESDKRMARTRDRPLPSGRLDPRVALALGALVAPVSVALLTFGANPLAGLLAALAFLLYVMVYTPMKRRSHRAILVGAIPGAMPPLIGWTAAWRRAGWRCSP